MSEKLSKKQVKHLIQLSKLELSDEEVEVYQKELSSILDYVKKLNKIDTSSVEPTAHAAGVENVMREDEVGKDKSKARKGDYYRTKVVLENQ
jgi:aspartyl-tRNA(Asn)/glutamyl-tRNA(Gln) amidotransferase subunit C